MPRLANSLDGKQWLQRSISIWEDLRKSSEEQKLDYPALFPSDLATRLIECFLAPDHTTILDPFCGSGSTLVAANRAGKQGIGFDLSTTAIALTRKRLKEAAKADKPPDHRIIQQDARHLDHYLAPGSVDLCITSPPYWNILRQRRTADGHDKREYDGGSEDLGRIENYQTFLIQLANVFSAVRNVMSAGAYCIVNVMDIRKKNQFYPFHADLAAALRGQGWIFDDLIIWNRQADYSNLRPLGYPAVFRINKVHEFLLIFRNPG